MKIPENRLFVMNNMMVIPVLILKKNLNLEELGLYCVYSSTCFDWWENVDEVCEALEMSRSKFELIRDSLEKKNCISRPVELPTEEEQSERASDVYKEIRENVED
ncbi:MULTISPECIES: hypothetical protein [Vibrio harveyi group]|uniref:hypothetical protein n=1 Tax=Vibrio harveyi group TaxID=717610 RepID=UPI001110F5F7|nr:hypothetical protein [Vibrio parahaemolyticus]MDG2761582.1 hypothetical protein [Vibrio parahaemolyticus]TMX40830.1 hypothetical protein DA098_03095 [Vibrio parahaemolyticus]TMX79865.1 hypothetical protein DA094_05105 [Vibrio parahaemolyticus]